MAISQMNWERMLFPLEDRRMAEFAVPLVGVYRLAELHQGFIWRIPDVEATAQLQNLGFKIRFLQQFQLGKQLMI